MRGVMIQVKLSTAQAAVLLGLGLQHKSAETVQDELDLPQSQVLAFHSKTIRKLSEEFDAICMNSLRALIPDKAHDLDKNEQSAAVAHLKPLAESLEDELNKAAEEIKERQLRDKKALLEQVDGDLSQYAINVDTKTLAKASDIKMVYSRPLHGGKREAKEDSEPGKRKKSFKKKKMI
ncbi:hypothetical protein OESDEN_03457 [Oesophagostomum dentatum]|uniref:Possible tRNA binding domain-containing protein n=1 Tax=Oesophagostomum dentatum TaxID=61180 RepID=A0A0B1TH55_OESDE|nr:hypothetical protein OESDEN_03457 [Oesophagostomum dentatum]